MLKILTFFILLFVYTKFLGPIPFSINSVNTTKSTTFDVSGEGKVTLVPDLASVSVGVRSSGSTVKQAQDQINITINKVTDSLKALGIDSKDIQTTNYSVNPDYDFSGGSQRVKGYSATTTVSIKVKDIEKINNVIDSATQAGANEVFGISFDVADEPGSSSSKSKAENEARKKAVDEAKTKAEAASKIAGFKLGRIINYTEGAPIYPGPIPLARGATQMADSKQTEVQPGSTDITITVTLSYEID